MYPLDRSRQQTHTIQTEQTYSHSKGLFRGQLTDMHDS